MSYTPERFLRLSETSLSTSDPSRKGSVEEMQEGSCGRRGPRSQRENPFGSVLRSLLPGEGWTVTASVFEKGPVANSFLARFSPSKREGTRRGGEGWGVPG